MKVRTCVSAQSDIWTSTVRRVSACFVQCQRNMAQSTSCSDCGDVSSGVHFDAVEVLQVDDKKAVASSKPIGNVAMLSIIQVFSQTAK
jgi:hypothetical protein